MQKKHKYNHIKLFIDFDGTITKKDIGNDFFRYLIGIEKFNIFYNEFTNNKVTIKNYWGLLFAELTKVLLTTYKDENLDITNNIDLIECLQNQKNVIKYLENCEIDDYFINFLNYINTVNLASDKNIKPVIVSDGFDFYIEKILQNHDINIEFECNSIISRENKLYPKFKLESESCNCFSASCKRNLILKDYNENDLIIYIGDGISDYCPVEYCDVIFAKGKLSKYCNQNNIPHYNFNNFFDIMSVFKSYFDSQTKHLKIRNQALIKRKLAFEIE